MYRNEPDANIQLTVTLRLWEWNEILDFIRFAAPALGVRDGDMGIAIASLGIELSSAAGEEIFKQENNT